MNNTGFYNVSRVKTGNKKKHKMMWQYQVKNKLVQDKIVEPSLQLLKLRVLERGYLWGVIDIEQAEKSAKKSNIDLKYLFGRYDGIYFDEYYI